MIFQRCKIQFFFTMFTHIVVYIIVFSPWWLLISKTLPCCDSLKLWKMTLMVCYMILWHYCASWSFNYCWGILKMRHINLMIMSTGTYSFICLNFFNELVLVYNCNSKKKRKQPSTIGSFMKTIGSLKFLKWIESIIL